MISKRFFPKVVWIACLMGIVAATTAKATSAVYYLSTGQTGAQTQIDEFHTTSWGFVATSNWSFGGGDFTMKDGGNGTTEDVRLSVYQGTDATGILVTSVNLTVGSFCSLHGGNCQSFTSTPFHFVNGSNLPAPYTVTTGLAYYIALTSAAPDVQSQAYFIKGLSAASFVDSQGNQLPNQNLTIAAVGEPMSAAILVSGFAGVGVARKRRIAR